MLTHERLTELIDYDPETGKMHYRITRKHTSILAGAEVKAGRIMLNGVKYRTRSLAWFHHYGYYPLGNIHLREESNGLRLNNLVLFKDKPVHNVDQDIKDYCARCPDTCNDLCPYYKHLKR